MIKVYLKCTDSWGDILTLKFGWKDLKSLEKSAEKGWCDIHAFADKFEISKAHNSVMDEVKAKVEKINGHKAFIKISCTLQTISIQNLDNSL